MSLIDLLILLLIAGVCGAIGQSIAGFSRGGCFVLIAIGFIGALIGSRIAVALGLPEWLTVGVRRPAIPDSLVDSGATLFTVVIGLLNAQGAIRPSKVLRRHSDKCGATFHQKRCESGPPAKNRDTRTATGILSGVPKSVRRGLRTCWCYRERSGSRSSSPTE